MLKLQYSGHLMQSANSLEKTLMLGKIPIQPSHPLLSPSPPTFNLSQHQGLLQRVSSSHQVSPEWLADRRGGGGLRAPVVSGLRPGM